MTATESFTWSTGLPIDAHLDNIRSSLRFLQLGMVNAAKVWPGWYFTAETDSNNYAEADRWIWTKGTMKIQLNLEWTGGKVTSYEFCYDDGVSSSPSLVCFDPVVPTYESGFTTTAKEFGGASPLNYYTIGAGSPHVYTGLIDSTGSGDAYQKLTLVFCIYPLEWGYKVIYAGGNSNFQVAIDDDDGGLWLARERALAPGPTGVAVSASGSPSDGGGLTLNAWHAVMIAFDGYFSNSPQSSNVEIWIDGVEKYSGNWGNKDPATVPMPWDGPLYIGEGKIWNGDPADVLHHYHSYVWANEEYLDPNTYWSSFFDESNKPKNIGADGSAVTGSAPFSFFPDADFSNNRGTGPNWVEVGTVPDAPSSPTD